MIVKVGDKIFDSNVEPILLIMKEDEKANIQTMDENCLEFLSIPENMSLEEASNIFPQEV
jgi:hypothetical protein